jgi:hypothetical protein
MPARAKRSRYEPKNFHNGEITLKWASFVTYTANSQDDVWPLRIVLNLGAQPLHMNVDESRVS